MFFQSNSGVLQVVIGEPPSNAPYNSGYGFMNLERMYVIPWDPAAPMPPDTVYSGGLARSSKGALYVVEGTPSDAEKSLGVPARTINGVAFVTTSAVGQGSTFNAPWGMVSSLGQIHIDASFGLGFADLGAGVVSTVAGISGATPTFTRATAASTVLSTGLIGTVASGSPRSYYDPTTLTYLGYLAEGARTNLLLHSADATNAAWTKTDVTPTLSGVGPDGGANTANLLTEGTAGTAATLQAVTATADVNYAVSTWLKQSANNTWVMLQFGNGANAVRGWVNVATGAAGSIAGIGTGTAVALRVKAYPNGFVWAEMVGSVGSGATAISYSVRSATADATNTRVNNAAYYVWGAQFENNVSFASSYIATAGATVTRNADVLTYPTSPWFNATEGTFFAQVYPYLSTDDGALTAYPFAVNDGTSNNIMGLNYVASANQHRFTGIDATVTQWALNSVGAINFDATNKIAGAYAVNDIAASANGGAVSTDTSASIPVVSSARIGLLTTGNQPFSPIRRVAYFPQRLTNAQLQAITQ